MVSCLTNDRKIDCAIRGMFDVMEDYRSPEFNFTILTWLNDKEYWMWRIWEGIHKNRQTIGT